MSRIIRRVVLLLVPAASLSLWIQTGVAGAVVPRESVSLNFTKVEYTYSVDLSAGDGALEVGVTGGGSGGTRPVIWGPASGPAPTGGAG